MSTKRLCTTAHERELTRRCNARPITGDELELIELLSDYEQAIDGKLRIWEAIVDSLAVVKLDNEERRVRISGEMADEGWRSEEAAE